MISHLFSMMALRSGDVDIDVNNVIEVTNTDVDVMANNVEITTLR